MRRSFSNTVFFIFTVILLRFQLFNGRKFLVGIGNFGDYNNYILYQLNRDVFYSYFCFIFIFRRCVSCEELLICEACAVEALTDETYNLKV
jgi:hypothetical protein